MTRKAKVIPLAAKARQDAEWTYELKVTLREVRPAVWRRLRVAGSLTLRELHHVLQIAVGWMDCHLHEFRIGRGRYGMLVPEEEFGEPFLDERDFRLDRLVRAGDRFEYVYDFGDDWAHEIVVEKTAALDRGAKARCIDGKRAGPPEDCGGAYGYERLLEVLANPRHQEHRDLREWVGPHFAPEDFDMAGINRELRAAGTPAFRRKRERFYEGH